ncbi:hypothetical protein Tco_1001023 [Tanacetum coccineum]
MSLDHLMKNIIQTISKELGAIVVEIVASVVVGVGIGVDCCGRGMNGEIGGGMVVAGAIEDSRITKTCTLRSGEV